MPVPQFTQRIEERELPIASVLLDPNNPRLSLPAGEATPEERIAENGVQEATLRKLNTGRFDMDGMRASIRRSGLLTLDRIVVRPLLGDEQFVVVEGNRRIGAIKTLLEQHAAGDITLEPDVLASIETPVLLVLDEGNADVDRLDQWVIQGIRHITGIREWGGFQAARTIETMISELGYDERAVADALTLSLQRVRRSIRVLSVLGQMQDDDEFGEYATPELYAYFDEVVKKPRVRDWLGWNPETAKFDEEERVRQLYSWIAPDEELNDEPRIPTSDGIRELNPVLDSDAALDILNTPGGKLADALRLTEPDREPEWRAPIERATAALRSIPMSALEDLTDEDRQLIEAVRDVAVRRLQQADRLLAEGGGDGEAV